MAVKNIFETMSDEKLDLYTEVSALSRKINPHKNEQKTKGSDGKTMEYVYQFLDSDSLIRDSVYEAKIKVIGIGGSGGNMINHMISEGMKNIDLIVANTDAKALVSSIAPYKVQLGMNTTRGLGSGMIPEKGKEAALESFDDIKDMLEGSDIVFISAGLGGGTGTGAAPIIAQAAKELGALTIAIVTMPFKFEGSKRRKLAKEGLKKLKRESDAIIVIQNERLLFVAEKNIEIKKVFKMVDDILAQAVSVISKGIFSHAEDENGISIDFSDVKTVMKYKGLALVGTGYSSGSSAAQDAAKMAIESPLLDNISMDGALGVLVQFDIHPDYPIYSISEAMDIIYDSADEDADVIFGTTTSEDMELDEVRITIVATGFEEKKNICRDNKKERFFFEPLKASNTDTIFSYKEKRKVVGGYDEENEDILEVPTFLRKQMD